MVSWQEQLAFMQAVAERFPHMTGRPIEMWRRGKRGRGQLREAMILGMCVAAKTAVREGEQTLVERDGRRRLAPHQVYDLRVRVLRLERDAALAGEYGVSQSSATRAIDGDTYRDVPFPIRVTHPAVPVEIYYPYPSAMSILAAASIDQQFTITIQAYTPPVRIPGLLRLLDQVFAAPPPAPGTPTRQAAANRPPADS